MSPVLILTLACLIVQSGAFFMEPFLARSIMSRDGQSAATCAHLHVLRSGHLRQTTIRAGGSGISEAAEGDSEPKTFEPVHVKDPANGAKVFSVLPPYLWPHKDGQEAVHDVLIRPGFGWGEGTHPSTYMCLQFLWEQVIPRKKPSVLDYGTGSGVLGIAAKRLGAGRVVGVDKDDEILEHAVENLMLNFNDEEAVEFIHGREVMSGSRGLYLGPSSLSTNFDVVIANMLPAALVRLAPSIALAVKAQGNDGSRGVLGLCGMRRDQVVDVKRAYEDQGITFFGERSMEGAAPGAAWAEWVMLMGCSKMLTEEEVSLRARKMADEAVN